MPFCPECGNEVKGDEKFCSNCGKNLSPESNEENKKSSSGWKKYSLIFAGIVAVLLIVGLIVNTYLGNQMKDDVETVLSEQIQKIESDEYTDVSMDYDDVKVNPLLRKVTISDVSLATKDSYEDVSFKIDELSTTTSYDNIKKILDGETLEEIDTFSFVLKKPYMAYESYWGETFDLSFDDVSVDFDGYLGAEIERDPNILFDKDQKFDVSVKGAKFSSPEFASMYDQDMINIINTFTEYDEISFCFQHDSKNKLLKMEDIKVTNSVVDLDTSYSMKYSGNNMYDAELVNYQIGSDFNLSVSDLSWGNASDYGKFTLDSIELDSKSDGVINIQQHGYYSQPSMPEGEYSLAINGFDIEFAGTAKNDFQEMLRWQFGVQDPDISKIELNELTLNYNMKDNKLEVFDSNLDSSLMDADLVADIDMNQQYIDDSKINQMKIEISNYHQMFEPMIRNLEASMGSLDRDGDTIMLDFEGTLGWPELKQH
ncbi:MAG: zinc-ribbon domain-containing protein [Halothermotrichaceae bacterium]